MQPLRYSHGNGRSCRAYLPGISIQYYIFTGIYRCSIHDFDRKFARHFRWSRISADKRFLLCLIRCKNEHRSIPSRFDPRPGLLRDGLHLQNYNLFLDDARFLWIFVTVMIEVFIMNIGKTSLRNSCQIIFDN